MASPFPFAARGDDDVELAVVDLGVARAFWEGVPAARLLARIRVDRDAVDEESREDAREPAWDTLVARLCGRSPASLERLKKAIVRHGRAASDEGPLPADDAAIAALVHAFLSAADVDASPAEGAAVGLEIEDGVRRGCGSFDDRLGRVTADRRAAAFEACLELATIQTALPAPLDQLARELGGGLVAATTELYPWGDRDVPIEERRALLLDRPAIERALATAPPRARLASAARALVARPGALVLFVVPQPRATQSIPPVQPSSWLPADFGSPEAASRLATALERGATTIPRARSLVMRGGDAALDQLGAEMLHVAAHPFASAAFAEILARAGRERDVVRLVTYFAIAPDPVPAARALSLSSARELPTVLRGWLESMLPSDDASGRAADDLDRDDPRVRLASSIEALAPYPHLHAAVSELLARVSVTRRE